MRFLFGLGGTLGWVFLIYFLWNKSIPSWFKIGFTEGLKTGSELVRSIPTEDWKKLPEPDSKKEGETEKKLEEQKSESKKQEDKEKNLFSGEINIGRLRSRYNLGIKQDEKSEDLSRKDMGVTEEEK